MSHVFISYSHEDADFVSRLDEIFQDEHIKTWVDKKRLKAGENWREAIDDGIKNAFALIVVLSPHAVVSPYVTYEWSFALGIGLEIIPVICRQIKFDDNAQKNREIENQLTNELENINHRYHIKISKPLIHPRLDVFQYIDLSHEDDNLQKWQDLIILIKEKQQNFRPHSVNVRREAPKIVHDMVAKLDSEDGQQRKNAVNSLSYMEDDFAEEALISALNHAVPDVRFWSAEQLGKKRSIKAIPALIKCVSDKNDEVRLHAVEALIAIGDTSIAPGLIQALEDGNDNIRYKATKGLGKIKSVEAVPNLIKLLEDTNLHLCELAVEALGEIRSEEAVPRLIDMLQHDYHKIRQASAKVLGNIRNRDSIPHLIKAYGNGHWEVDNEISGALNKIKPEDIPYLLETVKDQEAYYGKRDLVTSVLVYIGERAIPYLTQKQNGYVEKIVIRALELINTPEAQEALKKHR